MAEPKTFKIRDKSTGKTFTVREKIESPDVDKSVSEIASNVKTGLIDKAKETFDSISKTIPLSDRIKSAGLVGRGVEAIERGIKIQDAPSIAAKIGSSTLMGVPEFAANNPISGGVEQGAKFVGAVKDRSIFPKAATEEGEKLGNELGIAAAFATVFTPIKDASISERITKSAANKMKSGREAVANATEKIVEFDSKVRGELFGARVKAGEAFEASLENVEKVNPEQVVNLRSALDGLGVEVDEAGNLIGNNPKLLADIKAVFRKSGNKVLQRLISDSKQIDSLTNQQIDKAANLTLRESQEIIKSIKKIPSFAQKLNQGKFAKWTDTDSHVIQFIEDVRDAQLSAFPEFEKTLSAYRETMHKFRVIKPFFKETNLISNIVSDFQGKPVIQKFVRDTLPERIVEEIDSVRKVRGAIQASKEAGKSFVRNLPKGAGIVAGGGALFAAGKAILD